MMSFFHEWWGESWFPWRENFYFHRSLSVRWLLRADWISWNGARPTERSLGHPILFRLIFKQMFNHLRLPPWLPNISSFLLESNCSWCHQDISAQSTEIIGSQGTIFCSENCFLFWRRASFKRAKTCDFCKSVRNAVSYVDFNDGASQLQFCSDKCLNQYKMQIFCRETQAHLELNPHLKEKKDAGGKEGKKNEHLDSLLNKLRNFCCHGVPQGRLSP